MFAETLLILLPNPTISTLDHGLFWTWTKESGLIGLRDGLFFGTGQHSTTNERTLRARTCVPLTSRNRSTLGTKMVKHQLSGRFWSSRLPPEQPPAKTSCAGHALDYVWHPTRSPSQAFPNCRFWLCLVFLVFWFDWSSLELCHDFAAFGSTSHSTSFGTYWSS